MFRGLTLGAGLMMLGGVLFATPINICGTGFTAVCAGLAGFGSVDGNFTLIANADVPGNPSTPAYVALNQFPVGPAGPWVSDTSTGQWIVPAVGGNEMAGDAVGNYNYQESFNLTGFTLSTVTLSGMWAVDNIGCIYVNGANTNDCINSPTAFSALTAFAISSANATFVAGVNTITFETVNTAGPMVNPTGLFVELSGNGTSASGVPEPMTLSMLGVGLLGLGLAGRKLRK